jgi:hypothetical protein
MQILILIVSSRGCIIPLRETRSGVEGEYLRTVKYNGFLLSLHQ